jgi:hypothetical protein
MSEPTKDELERLMIEELELLGKKNSGNITIEEADKLVELTKELDKTIFRAY